MSPLGLKFLLLSLCALSHLAASATLVPSADGLTVYDTVNGITWLADANLAASSRFGLPVCNGSGNGEQICLNASGSMNYGAAAAWVAAMNAANYLGHNNWQLPTTPPIDKNCGKTGPNGDSFGFGCTAGALDAMYNGLGLKSPNTAVAIPNNTVGPFANLQPYLYWSQSSAGPTAGNYTFSFATGWQGANTLPNLLYLWPMIPGKLAGTPPASGTSLQVNAGGQTVYDPVTNVTWVANANLAATNTFGLPLCISPTSPAPCVAQDGSMTWDAAVKFLANMNSATYLGQNNWQAPLIGTCPGYGCGGDANPMGNLFYEQLSIVAGTPAVATPDISVGPFHNLQPYLYWTCGGDTIKSACGASGPVANQEWSYSFGSGFQGTDLLANNLYVTAYFVGSRTSSPGPAISLVANAEGESPTIAPNTWVEIKGANLAPAGDIRTWQSSDFVGGKMPIALDGVSVTVNGKAAFVYYISPTQINILTPPDALTGNVQVVVTAGGSVSAAYQAQAAPTSPSFFVINGGPYVVAQHAANYSLVGPVSLYPGQTTPAKPGETIVLYANGFGPTTQAVVSGSATQSGNLSPPPIVTIGGIQASVPYAALISPGLFQLNVVVPLNVPAGDNLLAATSGGVATYPVDLLTVQGSGPATSSNFYVAPNGNDSWSGALASPNPAGTDGPFATFDHARVAVAALNESGLTQVTVQFRGGTYYLPATVQFSAADSGTAATSIVYTNYPSESPIFRGGMGWTNISGDTWTLTLPLLAQTAAPDLRGIYIYTNDVSQITPATAKLLTQSFSIPGVDGVAVAIGWNAIEPSMGQYDWTLLDQWIAQVSALGKKIDLVVPAGVSTPAWLFQAAPAGAGASPLNFTITPHGGQTDQCQPETIAAPWDPAFLSQWDAMLVALAAHLKTAGTYSAVTLVRLTGINRTTEELRLPAETAQSTGLACVTNAIVTWQQAGYRPSLLLQGWNAILGSFLKSFPDKTFAVSIIPNGAFPAIDDSGAAIAGTPPDQDLPLLTSASQKLPGRLVVQFDFLMPGEQASAVTIGYATKLNTFLAFQTNEYAGGSGAACSEPVSNPTPCIDSTFLTLLQTGIYPSGQSDPLRPQYIEVFHDNAAAFPGDILTAHGELLPPGIAKVANAEGESPTIAPNTWVEIKGSGLSLTGDSRIWQTTDFVGNQLPTQLDGVSATVNGKPAYLYYISPSQVNILTPPDAIPGAVQVVLTNNGAVSASFTAAAQALSPSFFVFDGTHLAAAHLNGSYVGPTSLYAGLTTPAKPGELVLLFGNGFGPTSAPVVSGSITQGGTLMTFPAIQIGGITASVQYAGLSAPGEYQFNVYVPASLADGDQPVTASYGGLTTQTGAVLTVHR